MAVAYETYTDEYHGDKVTETDWQHVELVASQRLARLKTLYKVTPYADDEEYADRMAVCAMAEVIATWNNTTMGNGGLRSDHIGSVTEQYASVSEVMPKGQEDALIASIRPWLHVSCVFGAF
jgi:hypothetical protein